MRLGTKYAKTLVKQAGELFDKRDFDGVIRDAGKALEITKDKSLLAQAGELKSLALNTKAWKLATALDYIDRDGKAALKMAREAAKLNPREPYIRGTLAAAYAETGQFKKALAQQQKAIDFLKAAKRNLEAENFIARREIYGQDRPFRQLPDLKPTAEYKYYDITGSTVAELKGQQKEYGPVSYSLRNKKGPDGKQLRAWATALSLLKWGHETSQRNGLCFFDRVWIKAHIIYRMPRWTNRTHAPEKVRKKWDTFLRSLKRHEYKHGDIAITDLKKIDHRIRNLAPWKPADGEGCEGLIAVADRVFDDLYEEYRKKQENFDARSRTDGSVAYMR